MTVQKILFFFPSYKWSQYPTVAVLGIVGLLIALWISIGRVYYLRWFYERQGVTFVQKCYPVLGAELEVSKLRKVNKTHDLLYTNGHSDLIGTIRGFSLQLYGVNAEVCNELLHKTGNTVDRDSPALFSFGRLSPFAITFLPMSAPLFKQRKLNLIRALNDMTRLYQIANTHAARIMTHFNEKGSGQSVDIRELLDEWTRATSGEFIWGARTMSRTIHAYDSTDQLMDLPFMTALNQTFTALRFHSNKLWNRLYFPIAAWPITKEALRLTYNIRTLQREVDNILAHSEDGSVAGRLKKENDITGIPFGMTRDDIITATVGGLDTAKSLTMATLWNLLQPKNKKWKDKVLSELKGWHKDPKSMHQCLGHSETLDAVILESLRLDPPGSLINNRATADFDILLPDKTYRIKAGTRIVSCIHALHLNHNCWHRESPRDMKSLDQFDPTRFIRWGNDIIGSSYFMPFGKGPRRCPGQAIGLSMVKSFVATFLQSNSECYVTIPRGQSYETTCFHILSRATFDIQRNNEASSEVEGLGHDLRN